MKRVNSTLRLKISLGCLIAVVTACVVNCRAPRGACEEWGRNVNVYVVFDRRGDANNEVTWCSRWICIESGATTHCKSCVMDGGCGQALVCSKRL